MTSENFDQSQLIENDLASEWLGETNFIGEIIVDITACLAVLAAKRTTLEEKMIRQELHEVVASYGEMLATLHRRLSKGDQPEAADLERLRTLNFLVRWEVSRFLKALRYNLNYVEQYFEFDFCAHLREECRFAEEASALAAAIAGNK